MIDILLKAMIMANQRSWSGYEFKELCRTVAPELDEDELNNFVRRAKNDTRIKKTRVNTRKVYYSYRGLTE